MIFTVRKQNLFAGQDRNFRKKAVENSTAFGHHHTEVLTGVPVVLFLSNYLKAFSHKTS